VIRAQEKALATEKALEDPREKLDRTKGKTLQVSSKNLTGHQEKARIGLRKTLTVPGNGKT
jgi:hypothetical protein